MFAVILLVAVMLIAFTKLLPAKFKLSPAGNSSIVLFAAATINGK